MGSGGIFLIQTFLKIWFVKIPIIGNFLPFFTPTPSFGYFPKIFMFYFSDACPNKCCEPLPIVYSQPLLILCFTILASTFQAIPDILAPTVQYCPPQHTKV